MRSIPISEMLFAFDRHSDDIIIINDLALFVYSKASNCLVSRTTLPYPATAIIENEGQMLISTETGHVADFAQTPLKFRKISEIPILSLHTDNGKLYAATAMNMIEFDAEKFTYSSVLEFPSENVHLVFFRNQRLFAGDKTTIYCYLHTEGRFKSTGTINLNSPVLQFAEAKKNLIVATEDAVELFDFGNQHFFKALKKSNGLTILLVNELQDYTILSGYNPHEKTIVFYDVTSIDSIFKIRCSQAINFYKYSGSQLDDCRLTVIFGNEIPEFKNVDLQINKNKVFNLSLTEQMLGIIEPVKIRQIAGQPSPETESVILEADLSDLEQALLEKDYQTADEILEREDYDVCQRVCPENRAMLADYLVRGTNYWRVKELRRLVEEGYELTPSQRSELLYGRMCFSQMKDVLQQFQAIQTDNFVVGELEPIEEVEIW